MLPVLPRVLLLLFLPVFFQSFFSKFCFYGPDREMALWFSTASKNTSIRMGERTEEYFYYFLLFWTRQSEVCIDLLGELRSNG